jgi:hypothetical protein
MWNHLADQQSDLNSKNNLQLLGDEGVLVDVVTTKGVQKKNLQKDLLPLHELAELEESRQQVFQLPATGIFQ